MLEEGHRISFYSCGSADRPAEASRLPAAPVTITHQSALRLCRLVSSTQHSWNSKEEHRELGAAMDTTPAGRTSDRLLGYINYGCCYEECWKLDSLKPEGLAVRSGEGSR